MNNMTLYNPELFERLYEIFPESFSIVREIPVYSYFPTAFGQELIQTDTILENLGEDILMTAQAFSHDGNYMEAAYRYLQQFKTKKVQKQTIRKFLQYSSSRRRRGGNRPGRPGRPEKSKQP